MIFGLDSRTPPRPLAAAQGGQHAASQAGAPGLPQLVDTLIIGGGQAGLATSYYLAQQPRPHLVLEKAAQAGPAWRNGRWDSFSLVTPNRLFRLPGAEYQGNQPDAYMPRNEIVARLENYVARFHLPVRYNTQVTRLEQRPGCPGFRIQSSAGVFEAAHVVVATGLFQRPKVPALSASLPARIWQLHSSEFRQANHLPPGAVLVVGSGQDGCEIAEELHRSGRMVYLSVGSAGREPGRYRGKDIFEWLELSGYFDRTAAQPPSPTAKFACSPPVSGQAGGSALNLHKFARDGIVLLGRLQSAQGSAIRLASDLRENLAKADQFEADLCNWVDGVIARLGLAAPVERLPQFRNGGKAEIIEQLDLNTAGIRTIIWATGYTFDFSWIKLPIFDDDGFPLQQRGVTSVPGLYFAGLPWVDTQKTGLLLGVGEHAAFIASEIESASPVTA